MKHLLVILALVLCAPRPASAQDCAADADRLRAHLEEADTNTFRWNTTWTIIFGAAAAGQLALVAAEWSPFGDYDDAAKETLLVGAGKATLALGSRIVFPLRVRLPGSSADRCVELAELRKEVTRLGKKERESFWLTHIGGMVVNLSAVAFLWYRHDFKTGAISFAYSYPVGLTSAYTMPRASWKLWRRESPTWNVGVVPSTDAAGVKSTMFVLGGTF